MLIIGYDENIGPNGSIKIKNSQGTAWGQSGLVWMDCVTFQKLAQGQAFYVND
jgi:C1A family cysteine protease